MAVELVVASVVWKAVMMATSKVEWSVSTWVEQLVGSWVQKMAAKWVSLRVFPMVDKKVDVSVS